MGVTRQRPPPTEGQGHGGRAAAEVGWGPAKLFKKTTHNMSWGGGGVGSGAAGQDLDLLGGWRRRPDFHPTAGKIPHT